MVTPSLAGRRCAAVSLGRPLAAALALQLATAQAGMQFDPSFLEIGGGRAPEQAMQHLGTFSDGQLPGVYRVDITVNQKAAEQRDVRFIRTEQAGQSASGLFPCLDRQWFLAQGVAERALNERHDANPNCLALDQGLAGVTYDYDFNRQALAIDIPQAYLGQVPFALRRQQWSAGEAVAFTQYSLSASTVDGNDNRRQDQFASLRSGVNAGAWRLRNFSTWRNGTGTAGRWESLESYAQRDMGDLMAIATLGDATTEGDLFDAVPYRGLSVASDLDMLPDDARQFAPVVRGIANGRSRVVLRQRGYVIKEQWVPSGPFAITDLYSTASNGDIEVTVEGPDGQVQVYTQSFSSVPYMLREGQLSYALYAGRYRSASIAANAQAPVFTQATVRRGLSHGTTLLGGSLVSDAYSAGLLGVAHDFAGLGAVSVDITHARSAGVGPGNTTGSGQSMRFRYSKSLSVTDTHFSLVGYRYSTGGYYSFSEALAARANIAGSEPSGSAYRAGHLKSNFSVNLSQPLGSYGGLYANLSKSAYWDSSATQTSLQLGYNVSSGQVAYSLALGMNQGQQADRMLTLSVSLPLGREGRQRLAASTRFDSRGAASQLATLSGNALKNDALSYSAGVSRQASAGQRSNGINLAAQYEASSAIVRGGYSQAGGGRQLDLGIEGAVVGYGNHLILAQPLGETNVIVAAPGAAGVAIANKRGVRTDRQGYAVVPSALPYRKNRISLDTQTIGPDLDIEQLVQEVTPNRGAFVVADFETRQGRRVLFRVIDQHGEPAPFAANARLFAADGRALGSTLVADNGRVYLSAVPARARLSIDLGDQRWCSRELILDDASNRAAAGITRMDIQCQRPETGAGHEDS
ncbi:MULTISPECIES: fimbria/pilus outer membrane usher protein [unclassified Pseudomonas]|uniref:fimbria/pilus outer membrane usher protein n=1 Tax=unclassified Pseudomonas TaxID=196821 RepID=UPI000BCB85D2|nr:MULTISPECIES: fimbria/pilus outer membrane usher protein [unclassified Pseudomonas]PVZ12669.1 outer membrane usher protein [Pseudomonas sp. URIL14HWK12:I12]PVZ23180.1 outer membrane usher protein [Pseudomonas sp. URIL14HWK12:I10]PVZ32509.1 outer membrane usher protein [Pseudomonas sp. URIL14HWK12:I11]SNZ13566.1 outer membrane usher protein [Pseudomonas sp. URIL14HWK12:I9]